MEIPNMESPSFLGVLKIVGNAPLEPNMLYMMIWFINTKDEHQPNNSTRVIAWKKTVQKSSMIICWGFKAPNRWKFHRPNNPSLWLANRGHPLTYPPPSRNKALLKADSKHTHVLLKTSILVKIKQIYISLCVWKITHAHIMAHPPWVWKPLYFPCQAKPSKATQPKTLRNHPWN